MFLQLCLFIRSCWRVAELSKGFNGPLVSKEGIFIALDTIPMIIMSLLLTILHPNYWFYYQSPEQMELKDISQPGSAELGVL